MNEFGTGIEIQTDGSYLFLIHILGTTVALFALTFYPGIYIVSGSQSWLLPTIIAITVGIGSFLFFGKELYQRYIDRDEYYQYMKIHRISIHTSNKLIESFDEIAIFDDINRYKPEHEVSYNTIDDEQFRTRIWLYETIQMKYGKDYTLQLGEVVIPVTIDRSKKHPLLFKITEELIVNIHDDQLQETNTLQNKLLRLEDERKNLKTEYNSTSGAIVLFFIFGLFFIGIIYGFITEIGSNTDIIQRNLDNPSLEFIFYILIIIPLGMLVYTFGEKYFVNKPKKKKELDALENEIEKIKSELDDQ